MKARIWMEVVCCNCGGMIGWNYSGAGSVAKLEKATEDWVFDKDYGNLCPECMEALRKEKKGASITPE